MPTQPHIGTLHVPHSVFGARLPPVPSSRRFLKCWKASLPFCSLQDGRFPVKYFRVMENGLGHTFRPVSGFRIGSVYKILHLVFFLRWKSFLSSQYNMYLQTLHGFQKQPMCHNTCLQSGQYVSLPIILRGWVNNLQVQEQYCLGQKLGHAWRELCEVSAEVKCWHKPMSWGLYVRFMALIILSWFHNSSVNALPPFLCKYLFIAKFSF